MFINSMPTCERGLLFLNAHKKLDLLTLRLFTLLQTVIE